MFKKKIRGFAFFFDRSVIFLSFFVFLKKKNVGSGLILGSVGLRQYNNFFFWPYLWKALINDKDVTR